MNPINSFDDLESRSTRARKMYQDIRKQPGKARSTAAILGYIRKLDREHEAAASAPMVEGLEGLEHLSVFETQI